jgi:DNA ligase-1
MDASDIIERLAAEPSRTGKEQILYDAFQNGHRDFFIGAQLAYDALVSFGVKKVASIEEPDDGDPGTYTFKDFLELADDLANRRLTGHAARDAINDAASRCNIRTWQTFYRRVLLTDFKCGCETSTINKILKKLSQSNPEAEKYMVPVFGCQLAKDGADPAHEKKIKGVRMLDVKLDGVRLITVLDKEAGMVTQFSRNGHVVETFAEVREALMGLLDELPGSVVLDGEITAASFQTLMTRLQRKVGKNTVEAKLALFDIIPLEDFRNGFCATSQRERHAHLISLVTSGLLKAKTGTLCYVVPKIELDLDTPEGQEAFAEFNRQAIEADYEGIMIKDPEAAYEIKRSIAWLKMKPFIEVSLTVTELQQGEAGSKYADVLGALICEGREDGKDIRVSVGSGITDAERKLWWNNPGLVKGFIAEVRADCFSKAQDGEIWSLRFPRLKGWRGRVAGEKL